MEQISESNFTAAVDSLKPIWSAVDTYTLSHVQPSSSPTSSILSDVLERSHLHGLPPIHTAPTLAKLFALQCQFGKVRHTLELGTLGAYGSVAIALQNPAIYIVSVEANPKHAIAARENVRKAKLESRIEILEGKGLDILPRVKADIDAGKREKFGFTYIDADKQNNWAYFDMAVDMSIKNAAIAVDNVVYKGKLVAKASQDDVMITGAKKVIEEAGRDGRVKATVVQTIAKDSWDGILFAVVQ